MGRSRTVRSQLLLSLSLSAAIVSLAVARPAGAHGWLPAVDLFTSDGYVGEPHVVLDAEGNATAVWEAWNGEDMVIESAYRAAGQEWGAATDISETAGQMTEVAGEHNAAEPRITVDAAGDVSAIWERAAGNAETVLQADYRPAGGEWQAPVDISTKAPTASTDEPWIAADDAGDVIAVYKQQGVIRSANRPAGDEWRAPVTISEPGVEALTPQAAVDAAGDATAVWMAEVGSKLVARTAYRPAGEGWQPPAALSAIGEGAGDPQIALDARGDTMVVWQGDSNRTVRGAYRPAGGSWGTPSQISTPGEEAESLRLAVDAAGDTLVAWGGTDNKLGSYEWVAAAYRPAGAGWDAPEILSEGGANSYPQSVAFDQEGNAAIAWDRQGEGHAVVQVDHRSAGGEWEAPSALSDPEASSTDPVVVLDAEGEGHAAQGDATVIWTRSVGGCLPKEECEPRVSTIQAAGYDEDEAPEESFEAPLSGVVGEALHFTTPTLDAFSPVIEFGDGDSASASSTMHTYTRPGKYTIRFQSTELLGYRMSAQRTISISPASSPPPTSGSTGQTETVPTDDRAPEVGTTPKTAATATGSTRPVRALTLHVKAARQSLRSILLGGTLRIVCSASAAGRWKVQGPSGPARSLSIESGQRSAQIALTRTMLRALRKGHSIEVRLKIEVTSPGRPVYDTTKVLLVHG